MKKLLLLAVLVTCSTSIFAQRAKEIGIRLNNFDSFNVIYKTGKDPDHLLRIRSVVGNVQFTDSDSGNSTTNWGIGASVGRENHVALADRFDFIHGIEGGLTFNSVGDINALQYRLGYILGGVYEISDQFNAGVEIIPGAYYNSFVGNNSNRPDQSIYGFSFNTNSAALTLTYAFTK